MRNEKGDTFSEDESWFCKIIYLEEQADLLKYGAVLDAFILALLFFSLFIYWIYISVIKKKIMIKWMYLME